MSFSNPANIPTTTEPAVPIAHSADAAARAAEGLALAETKADLGAVKSADGCLRVAREYRHLAALLTRREDDRLRAYCTVAVMEHQRIDGEDLVRVLAEILGMEVPA